MQERTYATPSPRSFACDLATLCPPRWQGSSPPVSFATSPPRAGCRRYGGCMAYGAVPPRGSLCRCSSSVRAQGLSLSMSTARAGGKAVGR